MHLRKMLPAALAALLAVLSLVATASLRADEFRIHTKIFVGGEEQPAAENVTIFRDGLVYDCLQSPEEVALFDAPRKRFVLLNADRNLRTEIDFAQLETRIAGLRSLLRERADADGQGSLHAFLLEPHFEPDKRMKEDPDTKGFTLFLSPWFHYAVKAEDIKTPTAAVQYAEFVARYTQLNAMRNPAMLARLPINAQLAERSTIPVEIRLTTFKKGPLGRMQGLAKYKSTHNVTWALSVEDRRKIDEIGRWLVNFRQVSYDEYREPEKTASK
ncbi:MAG: hypothetical protein HYS13_14035 [Planctomycetia bacterium]|nr:hypothetical protein [Planctomycetia bacterium]